MDAALPVLSALFKLLVCLMWPQLVNFVCHIENGVDSRDLT